MTQELKYPLRSGDWHRDASGNLIDKSTNQPPLEAIEKVQTKPTGTTVTKANSTIPKEQ